MNRAQTFARIRNILLEEWDPLEVGDNPNLADEYDAYIPGLASLVAADAGTVSVVDFLAKIESDLGTNAPSDRRVRTAAHLMADNLRRSTGTNT
jgi:hypothetical protein